MVLEQDMSVLKQLCCCFRNKVAKRVCNEGKSIETVDNTMGMIMCLMHNM